MLYRNKGGNVWIAKFEHRGETVRESTGQTDKRAAKVEERRIRAERDKTHGQGGRRTVVTVNAIAGEDIKRALDEGADPATRGQTLKWVWAQVQKHLGEELDIAKIDFDMVLDYVGKRRATGAKGQTIRREVGAVKRGLLMAERRGWIGSAPRHWPKIKSDPPDEMQKGKLVAPEAVHMVLAELDQDARDEVMLIALTGLRAAEAKRAQYDWVEPMPKGSVTPGILRIPAASAKTRRERIVGLSQEALDLIKRRFEANPEVPTILSQVSHKGALRFACERAGVKHMTRRDLRHTYATLALLGTSDAVATMAALGHNDLRTTQLYQSSTVERTSSAGASVSEALGFGERSSPLGGHLKSKNSMGAHSSCG